jgi:hypothetical protein
MRVGWEVEFYSISTTAMLSGGQVSRKIQDLLIRLGRGSRLGLGPATEDD